MQRHGYVQIVSTDCQLPYGRPGHQRDIGSCAKMGGSCAGGSAEEGTSSMERQGQKGDDHGLKGLTLVTLRVT